MTDGKASRAVRVEAGRIARNHGRLIGESWLLADVDGRLEIQRRDEVCHASYSDRDALMCAVFAAADGDSDAIKALILVNFQKDVQL